MSRLKRNNRALLLSLLQQSGPLSRLDISELTGLTGATISGLSREMIEAGIIRELGPDQMRGPATAGRKPILLEICADARYAAGVVIHEDDVHVGVVDLRGRLLGKREVAGDKDASEPELAERALGVLDELLRALALDSERLIGVGVGIAGLARRGIEAEIYPNYLRPTYVSLRKAFNLKTKLAVFVDNNVKAMALGELLFGAGRKVKDLVFLKAGPGIGSAVVIDGSVYRGSHQGAGEIGHTVMLLDGPVCACGRRGCLEALASPRALVRQAKGYLADGSPEESRRLGAASGTALADVLRAAAEGVPEVAQLVDGAGRFLGAACANLVNLFDPEIIVLHGALFADGSSLMHEFESELQRHVYSQLPGSLKVLHSELGDGLDVIGAASLAFDRFFFSHRFDL